MRTLESTWARFLVPLAVAALLGSAPAAAQEPEPEDGRCICFGQPGEAPDVSALLPMRRARLGVTLGEATEVAGRPGVRLETVPEGTPAHRAGLRTEDVVVALDNADLGSDPGGALVQRMADVEPGDTVTVTFFRGDQERTARVATDASALAAFEALGDAARFQLQVPRAVRGAIGRPLMPVVGDHPGLHVARRFHASDLELAAVNAGLAEYFGTDRGVLVTAIDDDSPLGLRAGDVILAIGGREVRDPAHVRAILASYQADEEISFRVVRKDRTREVTGRRR